MIQIINGKKYNTETAKCIESAGRYCGDFQDFDEFLYQKKTGEFFLHGSGGPMSRYAIEGVKFTAGGEKIIPLTEEEARDWAEKHCEIEKYEELFGEAPE